MAEKLYRSRINRIAGGVASGLSDYFNIDLVLVRVLFIILTFFHGIGPVLYIILWIVVPERPFEDYEFARKAEKAPPTDAELEAEGKRRSFMRDNGRIVAGIVLIVMGAVFLVERLIPSFDFTDIFPIIIIVVGVSLIWNSLGKTNEIGS